MPIVRPDYRPPARAGRARLGDAEDGACCTSCATAAQKAAMMRRGARLVSAAVARGRMPAGMPPQGLQGLGDLFGSSLNDAIRALGPVGACISQGEAARVLASYEAQVNAQLHNLPERDADRAASSVSKSILLRQNLPGQICRPSEAFNSIVYMITELWAWLENANASAQIVAAAWSEAAGVAVDKVSSAVTDAAAGFESTGDLLLSLTKATKYLPWILGAVVALKAAPAVVGMLRKHHRRLQEA